MLWWLRTRKWHQRLLLVRRLLLRLRFKLNLKNDDDWGTCNSKLDPLLKEKLESVQVWAARAEASVPGSYQEKYANKQLNKYIGDFLGTLKGDKTAYSSIGYT